jgi:DNA-binding XRE family transcriptional regulator
MAKTLGQAIAALPAVERAKVEGRAAALIQEELSLRDLRKAMSKTQTRLAQKLKVGQDSVSRVEQRADMLISTLRSYVEAMGGELDLVASFPDRPPVRLKELGEIAWRPRAAISSARVSPGGTGGTLMPPGYSQSFPSSWPLLRNSCLVLARGDKPARLCPVVGPSSSP